MPCPASALRLSLFAAAACLALSACSELPKFEAAAAPAAGPAPQLVPVAGILAQADAVGAGAAAAGPVAARADGLRARAARLRNQ